MSKKAKKGSKKKSTITPEQLMEFYEAFCHFDKDASGTIDTEELRVVINSFGRDMEKADLDELVMEIDKDKSGEIDFYEFVELMNKLINVEVSVQDIKGAFEVFDKKHQGYIKTEDLKRILTTMGDKMTDEEADEMLKEADVNEDGKIDYEEFANLLLNAP